MAVVIGGGSGFIGTALIRALKNEGFAPANIHIISRKPGPFHKSWSEFGEKGIPPNCKAVVGMAGQNVFDVKRRWTPGFKQNVMSSRINTTLTLKKSIEAAKDKPDVFISMSGVGYYKPSSTAEYTEESPGGDFDFLSNLTTQWEAATELNESCKKVRRIILRSGVVLGRQGGVIDQMYLPFFLGVGGRMGSGKQFFPWIHISDLVDLMIHLMNKPDAEGIYNAVAPQLITNQEFVSAFGKALFRPTIFPVPKFALDFAFSEERAKILTEGQKVIPKRVLESGYKFNFPDINSACKECSSSILKHF